jgi:hypothetical protein
MKETKERRFYQSNDVRFLGVHVNAHGLLVLHTFRLGRRMAWDEFREVVVDEHGLTLLTRRGELKLGYKLTDWAHLAARCRREMGKSEDHDSDRDAVVDVSPEEVARWLGVAADGALVCRSPYFRRMKIGYILFCSALWCLTIAAALALVTLGDWGVAAVLQVVPALFTLEHYAIWTAGRSRRIREVRATPTELDVRFDTGWRRYAWGGIYSFVPRGLYWMVSTVEGDLLLPPFVNRGRTLLEAMREAIDARQRGFALPRMSADIPDAALSRAASAEVTIERGLSRAEDGEQP